MNNRLTEQKRLERQKNFIERMSNMVEHANDDYSFVEYINDTTKVKIFCKKCGSFYLQTPKKQKLGQSCPVCAKEFIANNKRGNWQYFINESIKRFSDVFEFPNIENEYINSHSKITIKCKKCGAITTRTACDHITNGGCKGCASINFDERNAYTYDRLIFEVLEGSHNIIPYDGVKYIVSKRKRDKVTCKCSIHGEYDISLARLLHTKVVSCPTCKKVLASTGHGLIPNVRERIESMTGNSLIFDETTYVNNSTPMQFTCRVCGHTFMRTVNNILSGNVRYTCPKCGRFQTSLDKTKSTKEFIMDAKRVYGDDAYDFTKTTYIQSNLPVTIKCNSCGRYFTKEANSFLQGNGCPYHNLTTSGCEKEIAKFIKGLDVGQVVECDRNLIKPLELDIYLPEKKIAFEFDGIFWHCETNKPDDYHITKTLMCEEKGVRLIHIFEDEWKHKQDICKSMIRNILLSTSNKIYARQCEVREVSSHDAGLFLDNCHIQGKCGSTYRYGLYYNNELVSLMTFGKSRHFIGNGKTEYELLRFCNKLNTSVVGGASKLLKHFIRQHNPVEIVSYADRRWSVGKMYEMLGFKLYNKSKPNYHYVIGEQRKNRFNFRKSILMKKYGCSPNMSEREFCKQQHWYRIYDCGCLCFKWSR